MYGLTNFLMVLWYAALGWFGIGREQARAVTLYNGDDEVSVSRLATDVHVVGKSWNQRPPVSPEWGGWGNVDPSQNVGPYTSLGEAVANGGAGVEVSKNLYI